MTWRAYAQHDYVVRGVAVHLIRHGHEGAGYTIVVPAELTMRDVPPEASNQFHPDEPSLRLTDDMARALMDALSAHYGGTSDVRTLRADLLHERGRVDRVIDYLIRKVG